MLDKLIIKGIDELDGEYPCDIVNMLTIGAPEALTNREGHRIKELTGLRAGELSEAFTRDDSDLPLALAIVILTRAGKEFDDNLLWDAQIGKITFDMGERPEEADASPPEVTPGDEQTQQTAEPPANGGEVSTHTAAIRLASDLKSTGVQS